MLKTNQATELGATNGAEGIVEGWDSETKADGREKLRTLFVRLSAPPRDIQIPGLPTNIVPITCHTETVRCTLPNDSTLSISREQVQILPNFAMTDFQCQGRTRPSNPLDLRNCRNHQSVYTCLSRSATLEGTLILYPFDTRKIMGGMAPDLKRRTRRVPPRVTILTLRLSSPLTRMHLRHSRT